MRFLIFVALAALAAAQTGQFAANTAAQIAILQRHNYWRAGAGVAISPVIPALAWDVGLAGDSQRYAALCKFPTHDAARHTAPSNSQPTIYTSVGENMYGSSPPNTNLTTIGLAAVNSWGAEKQYYISNQPTGSNCLIVANVTKTCGHYTQVMWRATTKVGCGYATCPAPTGYTGTWNVVICRYGKSGNFIGQIPFEETEHTNAQLPVDVNARQNSKLLSPSFIFGSGIVIALIVAVALVAYKIRRTPAAPELEQMTEALA
jgi:hypothetical protein